MHPFLSSCNYTCKFGSVKFQYFILLFVSLIQSIKYKHTYTDLSIFRNIFNKYGIIYPDPDLSAFERNPKHIQVTPYAAGC